MVKRICQLGILLTLLNGCVPNIVVDSKGRSGTFDKSRAEEITDDKFTCVDIVKDNVNLPLDYITYGVSKYVEFATLGIVKGKKELKSKSYNRNCLKGRGHSTIN